jgi:hypothetical protein
MHHTVRLAKMSEEGWELAAAYTIQLDKETRVCFILKRHMLL